MPIRDYQETPSANSFLAGIDLRETQMTPGAVNDAMRQMLADTKELQRRATLASASTTAIGAANSEVIDLTGSAVINAFDNVGPGVYRELHVAASPTFKHSTSLVMPGGLDFVAAAGDILGFRSGAGGVWKLCSAALADGTAISDPPAASADQAKTATNDASTMTPAKVALVAGGPWLDLATVAVLDLGALTSSNVRLTGSGVSVTSLGTAPSGLTRKLRLAGTTTFVNGTNLQIQSGSNITLSAGDTAIATSLGGGAWIITDVSRATLGVGAVLQRRRVQNSTPQVFATGTGLGPVTGEPAATAGNEVFTDTIELAATGNRVLIEGVAFLAAAVAATHYVFLFRGSTFLAGFQQYTGGAEETMLRFDFEDTPGSVGPHTYSVRVSSYQGVTQYFNRNSSGTLFGGKNFSNLTLSEIAA